MQIKKMPEDERPIEKVKKMGIETLSNSELLALLLRTGTQKKSAIALAQEILVIDNKGLGFLRECEIQDLLKIEGIGNTKACSILAVVELSKRFARISPVEYIQVGDAHSAADMFMEELRYKKKEYFKALLLNTKGKVISVEEISVGELSGTIVHPREVFNPAIKKSAAAIIFVHNHPSGDSTPSREDVRTTKRLIECGELLGIKVLDHIVIGDGEYSSLKRLNLI